MKRVRSIEISKCFEFHRLVLKCKTNTVYIIRNVNEMVMLLDKLGNMENKMDDLSIRTTTDIAAHNTNCYEHAILLEECLDRIDSFITKIRNDMHQVDYK